MTAVSGSLPLLLPSPHLRWRAVPVCVTGSALSFSLAGQHFGAASFTLCYGLLFCFPFSGSYNASTQSVTRLHRLPAIWLPDLYQNWTCTSEQMMIYQDTPRFVGWLFTTTMKRVQSQFDCVQPPWLDTALHLRVLEMPPKTHSHSLNWICLCCW